MVFWILYSIVLVQIILEGAGMEQMFPSLRYIRYDHSILLHEKKLWYGTQISVFCRGLVSSRWCGQLELYLHSVRGLGRQNDCLLHDSYSSPCLHFGARLRLSRIPLRRNLWTRWHLWDAQRMFVAIAKKQCSFWSPHSGVLSAVLHLPLCTGFVLNLQQKKNEITAKDSLSIIHRSLKETWCWWDIQCRRKNYLAVDAAVMSWFMPTNPKR